jgi:hypothetical protein
MARSSFFSCLRSVGYRWRLAALALMVLMGLSVAAQPATPTAASPEAAPAASCAPRPNVRLSTVALSSDRLQVTVAAGLGALQTIEFGAAANGLIGEPTVFEGKPPLSTCS